MRILFLHLRRQHKSPVVTFPDRPWGEIPRARGKVGKLVLGKHKSLAAIPSREILYGMSIFKGHGHEAHYRTDVPDLSFLEKQDLLVFHPTMANHAEEKETLSYIRRFAPDIRILVVGPFAMQFPELFLENAYLQTSAIDFLADAVVMDENPEGAFFSLAKGEINVKKMPKRLPCLVWHDLENLPYPDWSNFPWREFEPYGKLKDASYYPLFAEAPEKWREPEELIKEIGHHYINYGLSHFQLVFPHFLEEPDNVRQFSRSLRTLGQKLGTEFRWILHAHSGRELNTSLLKEMRVSGLEHVNFLTRNNQFEEASLAPLSELKKDFRGQLTFSKRYTFGLPGQSWDEALSLLERAKGENPLFATFDLYTPTPKELALDFHPPWELLTGHDYLPGIHPWEKEATEKLLRKAYREFYARKTWLSQFARELFLKFTNES